MRMMATQYDADARSINDRLKRAFTDSELQEGSVIRNFRTTAADGKRCDTKHYHPVAKPHAESEFEKYRIVQDRLFESDFDRALQRLDTVGLTHDDDTNGVAGALNVPKNPRKKPVSRGKGTDKGDL